MAVTKDLRIENAKIRFRNFAGEEKQFNRAGDRNFCVFLVPDIAKELQRDGWNIKYLPPREEGDIPQAYMQVKVSYDKFPPRIVLVTGENKTLLGEGQIHILDSAEIDTVDIVINPYNWGPINGKYGIKAYLKKMWMKIVEDEFEKKYRDVPDKDAFHEEDETPF